MRICVKVLLFVISSLCCTFYLTISRQVRLSPIKCSGVYNGLTSTVRPFTAYLSKKNLEVIENIDKDTSKLIIDKLLELFGTYFMKILTVFKGNMCYTINEKHVHCGCIGP